MAILNSESVGHEYAGGLFAERLPDGCAGQEEDSAGDAAAHDSRLASYRIRHRLAHDLCR